MFKNSLPNFVGVIFLILITACNSYEGELDGTWVSNKSRTLEQISNTMNLSERHQSIIRNLVGKMKHTIKGNSWVSSYDGVPSESTFVVLSTEENCYELLIDNSKNIKACLQGDELHLPSGIDNVLEVFTKK